ncbi:ras-related protein Rab-10-like [Halichondria panicea]|uniref:ras-related protein Rab-10-like n=1 Tax=Halichondria panicea TaxID=6063 RepID=UPI00312B4CD6
MSVSPVPSDTEVVVAATFKVLVLGNTSVGKSTLIRLYSSGGEHPGKMLPTVGVDFTDVIVNVRGTKVKLRIWDTAGQERFHTFTKQFFRGAHGIILVYDITSLESFQTLLKWIQTIHDTGLSGVSMVIVGNKSDLRESRKVPKSQGEHLAKRQCQVYVEASASTGSNVKLVFYKMAEALIHSHNIFQPGQEATSSMDQDGDISMSMDFSRRSPPKDDDTIRLGNGSRKVKCCQKR